MDGPGNGFTWSGIDGVDRWEYYITRRNMSRIEYKITAMPITNHQIEIGYIKEQDIIKNRHPFGDGTSVTYSSRLAQMGDQDAVKQTYNFGYRGVIGDSIFIEARYNKHDNVV